MAGPRQPTNLVLAKGKKHFTKDEIAQRLAEEVQPCADDLAAPPYLTAPQKKRFDRLAQQLDKLRIMGETDTETLARYVTAQCQYEAVTKDMRALNKKKLDPNDEDYYDQLLKKVATETELAKLQDRYFKQAQTAAAALGLTISSRCKLVAPVKEEAPKVNKFEQFSKAGGGNG